MAEVLSALHALQLSVDQLRLRLPEQPPPAVGSSAQQSADSAGAARWRQVLRRDSDDAAKAGAEEADNGAGGEGADGVVEPNPVKHRKWLDGERGVLLLAPNSPARTSSNHRSHPAIPPPPALSHTTSPQRPDPGYGGSDLLHVVVTWSIGTHAYAAGHGRHPRDIRWLAGLHAPAKLLLYAKGVPCAARPAALAHVACHEEANAGGREAHTMILHAARYYDALARFTFFLHDDATPYLPRINRFADAGVPDRIEDPTSLHEAEGHDRAGCLCDLVVEDFFTAERYGPLYAVIHHLLRTFFHTELNTTVRRPRPPRLPSFYLCRGFHSPKYP